MKSTKFLWSGVLILGVLLIASYLIPNIYYTNNGIRKEANYPSNGGSANNNESSSDNDASISNNYNRWGNGASGYGMMGGYEGMMGGNWGFNGHSYTNEGLSEDKVNQEVEDSLKNSTIDKEKNSVTYNGNSIKIVLLASSKQADDKFTIGGLVNPTVYIPKNSTVTLELINEDEDVPHATEITNAAPPYAYNTMMQSGIYPGSFINYIPPSVNGKFYTDSTSFTANYNGEFYYICQYPGHATEGMYGKIIVK